MKKEQILESTVLLCFIGIMLWIGIADNWGHRIQHDFPTSYLASDTFQHQTRAQWIKDAGEYKYEAPYYSAGFENVVGFYPPILNHITVMFSHASGLEVYDAILFLTVFFAIIGALTFYLITRQWNKHIAMLSLPIMTYLFTIREARIAFFWGHWPALLGDFFLVATCWMLINLQKKYAGLFLGLMLAGTALGHTAATVFAVIFMALFFGFSFLSKKFNKEQFKKVATAIVVFTILSAYVLILFKQTWMVVHPFEFQIETTWTSGGGFIDITEFGYPVLILMAIGLVLLVLSKNNENFFQKLLAIFALLAGYTNYIGFTVRAFNFRFYWPILLSIFFGTTAYKITKTITKEMTLLKTAAATIIITVLLLHYNYQQTDEVDGLMNKYTWQTLNWIKDNTPPDAKPFFFYGDAYDQDASLGNTHRRNTRVEINELSPVLQNKTINRNMQTKELIESGTQLPYHKGLFEYGLLGVENQNITGRKERDLCSFDYYVFDKFGRYPVLVQLNQLVANTMLQHNFTLAFQNDLSVILKNPQPGGKCIGANDKITF